jgi:molybdopterin biosynthesis enzyme
VVIKWDDTRFVVTRPRYNGSGHFHALTHTNGLMKVPVGVNAIGAGGLAEVKLIRNVI